MHEVLSYILHTGVHTHTRNNITLHIDMKNQILFKNPLKLQKLSPVYTQIHTFLYTGTHTRSHTRTPLSHRWLSEGVRASWGLCLSILWATSLEPNFIFLLFLLFISSSHSPSLLTWHSFITCRQGFCFTAIRMQVVHHSNLGRGFDSFTGSLSSLKFWCGSERTLHCPF